MDLKTFLQEAILQLQDVSETPSLDAQVLAAHYLNATRSWILAHPEAELTFNQLEELQTKVKRLREGFPLPYLLGKWEFYGHEFIVTPQVLIPRPETELMVELALKWLTQYKQPKFVVDIGTGSGCIAVSIALGAPFTQIIASDISMPALQVAQENVLRYGLDHRIHLICAKDIPPINSKVDLVCANLPYIPCDILSQLPVARYEPKVALDGGPDGLQYYRRIIPAIRNRLTADSLILCEIDPQQIQPMMEIAVHTFPSCHVQSYKDLSGKQRVIAVQPYPSSASKPIEEYLCS